MSSETVKKQEGHDIYTVLRDDIMGLRLKPGIIFSIKDICELYQSGRTPARDALIRLEQEGMITFLPQRGTMISRLDLRRIDNERFIRRSIEENVMRDFVAAFSPTVILRLEDQIQKQQECMRAGDVRGFFASDEAFHFLFYKEINRMYCWDVIQKECCNYKRMRLLTLMLTDTDNAMVSVLEDHEAIVSAVSMRDLDKVMHWSGVHLDRIRTQEHKLLKQFPDLFEEGAAQEQDKKGSGELAGDFLISIRSRGL